MKIDFQHRAYTAGLPAMVKCRDAEAGEDQVKGKGVDYLPSLDGQLQDDYDAYIMRAMFYNATGRTVQGMTGAILGKDPTIEFKDDELLEHVGVSGEPLDDILRDVVSEALKVGRIGVQVDANTLDDGAAVPYISLYYAENIINWRVRTGASGEELTLVVLEEEVEVVGEDGFEVGTELHYRVLQLGIPVNDEGEPIAVSATDEDGLVSISEVFYVEIWKKAEKEEGAKEDEDNWIRLSITVPTKQGGDFFDYIPFQFINATGITSEVEQPPILDLVNVNYSHYRTSADLEHGRHYTALPTAWIAGFDTDKTNLKIGSTTAWVSDNPEAKAGFLEFTGAGLSSLAEALTEKEKIMAVLGARMLESQPKGVEAADTVRLRHSGERSVLANIAKSVSDGMTVVLGWLVDFQGQEEDVSVQLTDDFEAVSIDPQTLVALMSALQTGNISWNTWFYNIKRAQLIPDGRTEEEERELIEVDAPPPPKQEDEEEDLEEEDEDTDDEDQDEDTDE